MKGLVILICMMIPFFGISQNQDALPKDFLSKDFHRDRREKLREQLPQNSVAVFFANPVRNRSNDVDYTYHQDPDFYYLTGYKETDAVLFVFKDSQAAANETVYDEIIFVRPRNESQEMWTGRRLGMDGVKSALGLNQAFNNSAFKKYSVDFSKFDQVLFFDFTNDVRDDPRDSSDLYSLIEDFKYKINYPTKATGLAVHLEPHKNNLNTTALGTLMANLRGIKTKEELALIKKAVNISCAAQREVMKAIKPGMSEREIQGIHEFVFKKYQAEDVGYPSIVGAGHNGCILHYIDNYKPEINSKELMLMDLGAEYRGYTADITRTIPVSGKFSADQKKIYDIVLAAQEEAMKLCRPGTPFADLKTATRKVVNRGLKDLGILKNEADNHSYYPHGCCHHIGLDVHDKGNYDLLQENMVITIEPGIYIPENSNCDRRWWGIAVRIEDDYLITKDGYEHLSTLAPRKSEEIEALMKQPSALDDFVLPDVH
jgi:Xaa-Pro aminopeptidase